MRVSASICKLRHMNLKTSMNKAFVLGAGLGTRLKPLTEQLPKPLIPVFHRPLITYAFDHLIGIGINEFIVNTHHLSHCYNEIFPNKTYHHHPITFRHESVLLETAGGIANITDLVPHDSFIVYNGDILTDLPLAPLIRAHRDSNNIVTLVLRSSGPTKHIAYNESSGLVSDIRNILKTGNEGSHQFTGIYAVSPEFQQWLTPGKIESVIPIFLNLIQEKKRLGGVVIDDGYWWDLGERESYLNAHAILFDKLSTPPPISSQAYIHPSAILNGLNLISDGASVAAGVTLEDCILWPNARVTENANLHRCIVRHNMIATGTLKNVDV